MRGHKYFQFCIDLPYVNFQNLGFFDDFDDFQTIFVFFMMTFSYNLTLTWCFSGPECFINVYNYNGVYKRGLICFGYLVLTILTFLTIFDDFYVFETKISHRMAIYEPILIIQGSFEPSWETLEEVQNKFENFEKMTSL